MVGNLRLTSDHDSANGDYVTLSYRVIMEERFITIMWLDGNGSQLCSRFENPANLAIDPEKRVTISGVDLV